MGATRDRHGSVPDEEKGSSHPHLKAFIERGMGHRLSKKMVFEKLNKQDFLKNIREQMEARKEQDLSNKVDKIMEERNHLREFKKKIIQD
jgi:hypothetical protein